MQRCGIAVVDALNHLEDMIADHGGIRLANAHRMSSQFVHTVFVIWVLAINVCVWCKGGIAIFPDISSI